jgi:DNA mismatch repair protein MutS
VAQLAGVPRPVIQRAEELLKQLESGCFSTGDSRRPKPYQPLLFAAEHPVVEALRALDVAAMTPLEAINVLYQLQQQAGEAGSGGGRRSRQTRRPSAGSGRDRATKEDNDEST